MLTSGDTIEYFVWTNVHTGRGTSKPPRFTTLGQDSSAAAESMIGDRDGRSLGGTRGILSLMSDVTRILEAICDGDSDAVERLLPLVYDELRRLAAAKLAHEAPGQTLQATALVHEVYLRLVGGVEPRWETRGHFFTAAAEAMRRILIDRARSRKRQKRGGGAKRLALDELDLASPPPDDELLALDEALSKLAVEEPVKAELVKLRFFAGLSVEQAAAALGISRATADRYWSFARAWLFHELAAEA